MNENNTNFINFINHLLTFNKQMNLFKSKNLVENNSNSNEIHNLDT
jgi:hypothetical protein